MISTDKFKIDRDRLKKRVKKAGGNQDWLGREIYSDLLNILNKGRKKGRKKETKSDSKQTGISRLIDRTFSREAVELIAKTISEMHAKTISEKNDGTVSEENKIVCQIEEFCDPYDPSITTYQINDIYKIYDTLGENDIISIISQNGFLEVKEEFIFNKMCQLAKKNVEIRYYYPSINSPSNSSFTNYKTLKHEYKKQRGISDKTVSGYMVREGRNDLFGWGIRYILISRWDKEHKQQKAKYVFIYIESSRPEEDITEEEIVKAWIPFHNSVANRYLRELHKASEPVEDLGVYSNRLNSEIQKSYHILFSDSQNIGAYNNIREWAGTSRVLLQVLNIWKTSVKKQKLPLLITLLDIGTGDGYALEEFVSYLSKDELLRPEQSMHITAVEPAHFLRKHQSNILKNQSLDHSVEHTLVHSVEHTFEDYSEHPQRNFDIIISCHSLYVIDPTYLKKMYNLLSDVGVILIVISPLARNIINQLTFFVDELLPLIDSRVRPCKPYPYEGKVIKTDPYRNYTDPYRNYSEDIEVHLKKYFGEDAFLKKTIKHSFDISNLVDNGELTEQCKEVLTLFSNRELDFDIIDKHKTEIVKIIKDASSDDKVHNDVCIFAISKSKVRETRSGIVNGK